MSRMVQMAKEHVEYSMAICVFGDTKWLFMLNMIVWQTWQLGHVDIYLVYVTNPLILFVDMVGGIGTMKANPSQIRQHYEVLNLVFLQVFLF